MPTRTENRLTQAVWQADACAEQHHCGCVCWNDCYMAHRTEILSLKDKVIILAVMVRYSNFNGCNALQMTKNSLLFIQ